MDTVTLTLSRFTVASAINGTHVLTQFTPGIWQCSPGVSGAVVLSRLSTGWLIQMAPVIPGDVWRIALSRAQLPIVDGKPVGTADPCPAGSRDTHVEDTGALTAA